MERIIDGTRSIRHLDESLCGPSFVAEFHAMETIVRGGGGEWKSLGGRSTPSRCNAIFNLYPMNIN